MEVRSVARNLSVAPKKLRPIINTVRGKPVQEAMVILQFLAQPAANDVAKVIKSAAASAENNYQLNPDALRVVTIKADEGIKLRRMRPMARGKAGVINKRHTHITVVVSDEEA
jgi:large subunit ribosomal protein L22